MYPGLQWSQAQTLSMVLPSIACCSVEATSGNAHHLAKFLYLCLVNMLHYNLDYPFLFYPSNPSYHFTTHDIQSLNELLQFIALLTRPSIKLCICSVNERLCLLCVCYVREIVCMCVCICACVWVCACECVHVRVCDCVCLCVWVKLCECWWTSLIWIGLLAAMVISSWNIGPGVQMVDETKRNPSLMR